MSKDNSDFFKVKNNWSLIKDKLLGCYLTPYMQKILATNKKICYVDCFSGKGKFEDNQPGSPLIALQIRDDCLGKTRMRINKRQAIDMTFIDLNYASGLETNLAMYDNCYGKPNIVSGKYPQHKHFYNAKAQEVIDFCTQRKIAYHIKDKTITEE